MTLIKGHLNQLLTTYAVATAKGLDQDLIGSIVAPEVRVNNYSDSYLVFGEDDLRIDPAGIADKSLIGRVTWTESDTTYTCQEWGLEAQIPWLRMNNADSALRLERRYTIGLARKLRLRAEKAVADLLFNVTTYAGYTAALAAADRWDIDASFPVLKVSDALESARLAGGIEPNAVVVGAHVWSHLRNHPDITSRVAGLVAGTPATTAQAAAALGVERVIVGKSVYNSAAEAATVVHADLWGKYALVTYIDPSPTGDAEGVLTPATQFVCDAAGAPFSTFTYEENQTRSHVIQCYDCRVAKSIAPACGYLFSTVVS